MHDEFADAFYAGGVAPPFGIVIEALDPQYANASLEVPYPDRSRPVYDAENNVVGYEAKRFWLSFHDGRSEVSVEVWEVIQASMERWPLYPRIVKAGETSSPATQHAGGQSLLQPRLVYVLDADSGLIRPEGEQLRPVTPYSR